MLRRAEQSFFTSKKTMVPTAGLEPAQVAPLAPQTSASTNFATSACLWPDGQKSSWAAPKLFPGFAERTPYISGAARREEKYAHPDHFGGGVGFGGASGGGAVTGCGGGVGVSAGGGAFV